MILTPRRIPSSSENRSTLRSADDRARIATLSPSTDMATKDPLAREGGMTLVAHAEEPNIQPRGRRTCARALPGVLLAESAVRSVPVLLLMAALGLTASLISTTALAA